MGLNSDRKIEFMAEWTGRDLILSVPQFKTECMCKTEKNQANETKQKKWKKVCAKS